MSMSPSSMSDRSPVDWGNTLYRSSRTRTLVVIILAVLALAGAGVLAGALYDQPTNPLTDTPIDANAGGPPAPERAPAILPQIEASPTAGASTAPSPAASASAVSSPSPATNPSPSPSPVTGDTTGGIVLGGGIATVPVPAPWTGEAGDTGTFAILSSGEGDWAYVQVSGPGSTQATADAILGASIENFLPPEQYTQLQHSEVTAQQPFGSLLSIAYITFSATYVDTQGSAPDAGAMWVAVRQDGALMIATADSMPPEKFGAALWKPVIFGAFNSFAGTSP